MLGVVGLVLPTTLESVLVMSQNYFRGRNHDNSTWLILVEKVKERIVVSYIGDSFGILLYLVTILLCYNISTDK